MYYTVSDLKPEEVVEYLRKSRADNPLLSVEEVLEQHEKILNEWAERNLGGLIPEDNVYREVYSGETIDARPQMLELLRRIESPHIKAIFVVEIQRLSRGDLEDAGRLIKLIRYTHTLVITPVKTYDLEDDYDRDAFERELKRGNDYLEYTKKIMLRGRLASVKEGNYIGSIPPYGYDKTFVAEGKKKYPTLKINESEAEIVRTVFDLYVNERMGPVNIANYLDSLGTKPRIAKHWTQSCIKDMLSNVHYIGKVRWNHRKGVTTVEDGELLESRPRSNDELIFDGKHEAIISENLFYEAQNIIGTHARARKGCKIRNPFAGLVYCSCGRAMSLRTYIRPDGTERSAPRLLCDDQSYCSNSSCTYQEFIEAIKPILQECINDFEIKLKEQANNNAVIQHKKKIAMLENKLAELQEKELRQWEMYNDENESMPKYIFDKLNAKVLQDIQDTRASLNAAYNNVPEEIDYQDLICKYTDALNGIQDSTSEPAKLNSLLKSIIERINYSKKKSRRYTPNDAVNTSESKNKSWISSRVKLDIKYKL